MILKIGDQSNSLCDGHHGDTLYHFKIIMWLLLYMFIYFFHI